MDISFTAHDGIQDNPFVVDFDPGQFRGTRTTFGAEWYVPLLFKGMAGRPLAASGTLAWATENGYGLQIPMQPVGGGSCALTVPISDHELARIDERRAGGESLLQLSLNVLALRPNGTTAIYKPYGPLNYTIPLHRWIAMLADTGFGKIQIVELPVPPDANGAWEQSARQLGEASVRFRQGDYGVSTGCSRIALQQMVEVLERALAITPKTPPLGPRIQVLTKQLNELHQKYSFDPYVVIARLIQATFDFASDPVHRGYEYPTREDAALALSLATALHRFLASRPLPKLVEPTNSGVDA